MELERQRNFEKKLVYLLVALLAMSLAYIVTLFWVAFAMNSVMNIQVENSNIIRQMFTYIEKNQSAIGEDTRATSAHTEALVEKVDKATKKLDTAAAKSEKAAKSAATASANTKATKVQIDKVEDKIDNVVDKIPQPAPPKRRSLFGK
jgi:chemotaxis protein histidine kinase CheA